MDPARYNALCALLAAVAGLLAVLGLYRVLARTRPGLGLAGPLVVGYLARMGAILVVAALGSRGTEVRGPDDAAFFEQVGRLSAQSLTDSSWWHSIAKDLQLLPMDLQMRVLGFDGNVPLRPLQAALGLAGILLIAVAVHDVAGRRAGLICMWIGALEPSNVFFSTLLHKESLFMLGQGLVVFGLIGCRTRVSWSRAGLMLGGLVLIGGTRDYATLAFVAVIAAMLGTTWLARRFGLGRVLRIGVPAVAAVGLCGLLVGPRVAPDVFARLQLSHDFKATGAVANNLDVGHVDMLTGTGVVRATGTLTTAFVVRPYPWQLGSLNQQIGAIATLLWWVLLAAVLATIVRSRWRWTPDILPFVYVIAAETVMFSLTLINTGLGFRHRIHVIVLVAGIAGILWRERGAEVPGLRGGPKEMAT